MPRDQPSERKSGRQANRSSSATAGDSKLDLKKPLLDQILKDVPENLKIETLKRLHSESQARLRDHKQNLSDEERMSEGIDELSLNECQPSRSASFQETDRGPYLELPVVHICTDQSIFNTFIRTTSTPTPPPVPPPVPENNRSNGPSLAQGPNVPRPPQAPPAPVCPVAG